jgi:hypothetical protein
LYAGGTVTVFWPQYVEHGASTVGCAASLRCSCGVVGPVDDGMSPCLIESGLVSMRDWSRLTALTDAPTSAGSDGAADGAMSWRPLWS